MFKMKLNIDELKEDERKFRKNLFNDINSEIAIQRLIKLRVELNYEKLIDDEELFILKDMIDKYRLQEKKNDYEKHELALLLELLSQIYRIYYKDTKQSLIYLKEALDEVRYTEEEKVKFSKPTDRDFELGRIGTLLRLKFLMKDLGDDYFLVTNDMTLLDKKQEPKVILRKTSIKKFIYTFITSVEADINMGLNYRKIDRNYIYMYYALYRYINEVENRDELKKHILNNAYELVCKSYTNYGWNTEFMDLAYVYPEVFEGFIENEYTLQKTTLPLIDFSRVEAIDGFTEDEESILKQFQKEKNTILVPKPKKLKMLNDFREDLMAISHNSKVLIKGFEEELKTYPDDLSYREEESKLNLLEELCDNYNKSFWTSVKIYGDECGLEYLERYTDLIEIYEELIEIVEEKPIIGLGKACYNLALCYEYAKNEALAKEYFKKAALYLPGALPEMYEEESINDIDNSSINYIRNAYANFRIGNLDGFYNAEIDDTFIEDNEEIIEELDLNEFDYTTVYNVTIKEFINLTKLIIKVEEAKGLGVKENKILLNIIKELWEYKQTKDELKRDKIKKNINKLYNLISNNFTYIEYYPLCLSLYNSIESI